MRRLRLAFWGRLLAMLTAGLVLAVVSSFLAMFLSAVYWGRRYPHDGQTSLGVLAVGLFSFPVFAVCFCTVLPLVKRHWIGPMLLLTQEQLSDTNDR